MSRRGEFTSNLGAATVAPKKVLIIKAGQSNTLGVTQGVPPPIEYRSPNPNCKIMGAMGDGNPAGGWLSETSTFDLYDYDAGNSFGMLHGSEPSISKDFGSDNIWILKVSEGDSTLHVDWAEGSKLRDKLIEKINLAYSLESFDMVFFSWNQWESDTAAGVFYSNYDSNFKSLITDLEQKTNRDFDYILGAKPNPEYPNNAPGALAGYNVIEPVYQGFVTYYGGKFMLMNYDDLIPFGDSVHYTGASQLIIGSRETSTVKSLI